MVASLVHSPAGKRSDIDSEDLIQSVPERRSQGCGCRAIGIRLLVRILVLRRCFFQLVVRKGAGLVPFFNLPRLDRKVARHSASVVIRGPFPPIYVRWVPSVERMGLFSVTMLDRYKGR